MSAHGAHGGAIESFVADLLERRKGVPTSEGDREFFLLEIRQLKERLDRAEQGAERFGQENAALVSALAAHKADQADIFAHMTGELAKKQELADGLAARVQALEEEVTSRTADHAAQLAAQEGASAAERERLEAQIAELTAARDEVVEREQRENGARPAARLAALEAEHAELQQELAEIERGHTQEKDRLKKEMLHKLRETKATLQKMTANQLDATTKRTIAENEQLSAELGWQSKEAGRLVHRNERLEAEGKVLRSELQLHREREDEFAKKVRVYQKSIKALLSRLDSVDLARRSELETLSRAEEEIQHARALASAQASTVEEEASQLRESVGSARTEVENLREQLARARARAERRDELLDDGIRFLLECLEDARADLPRAQPSALGAGGAAAQLDGGESRLSELNAHSDGSLLSAEPSQLADLREPEQRAAVLDGLLRRLQSNKQHIAGLASHRDLGREDGAPPARTRAAWLRVAALRTPCSHSLTRTRFPFPCARPPTRTPLANPPRPRSDRRVAVGRGAGRHARRGRGGSGRADAHARPVRLWARPGDDAGGETGDGQRTGKGRRGHPAQPWRAPAGGA